MTSPTASPPPAVPRPWTCPFCPLLCDTGEFRPTRGADGRWRPDGLTCTHAAPGLAAFGAAEGATSTPRVGGRAATLDDAVAAAAALLAASRQPLIGGLGTDVAGARALYRLACATGAISDAAGSGPLIQGLRALQDRGGFTTTLAELRTRAELIVFFGDPGVNAADLLRRAGLADEGRPAARIVVVGAGLPADAAAVAGATPVESLPWHEDVFASVALLAALVDRRAVHGARDAAPGLVALAERLHASRYTVIVWDAAALPAQGALVIEALQRVIATLNRTTRAAAFPIGLGAPAATANQVHAWLSGLPLRTRVGPRGLEHEPLCFDAARLLADGAVDALLWVASFGLTPGLPALPASARLPRVVLAHPAFDAGDESDGAVFIPVSTPGVGTPGHLFRTDGVVLLPLHPIDPDAIDPLPTVADIAARIERKLMEMAR